MSRRFHTSARRGLMLAALGLTASMPAVADMQDDAVMTKFRLDRFENRRDDGEELQVWEAQLNVRSDYHGLALKIDGERPGGGPTESAEYQLLYQRLVSDFFDGQIGVRYDDRPEPSRTYAVVGFQGLAPYWFEIDANLYLSDEGDLSASFEAEYDLLLTQRLVLQPAAELSVAFSDDGEVGVGSGLGSAELGLRLRYELHRKFAPYLGVNWERKFGDTADFARNEGQDTESTTYLLGVTAWF